MKIYHARICHRGCTSWRLSKQKTSYRSTDHRPISSASYHRMTQVKLKARCNLLLCFGDHKIAFDIKDTPLLLHNPRRYDCKIILVTTEVSPALSPMYKSMMSDDVNSCSTHQMARMKEQRAVLCGLAGTISRPGPQQALRPFCS